MNAVIILGIVILVVLILLNIKIPNTKDKRKQYLQSLADYLETKLEPMEGQDHSYRLRFVYKNKQFIFEDVEDRLQNSCVYKVFLKAITSSKLKIDFTERPRTTIRANVQSLDDLKAPWLVDAEKVILPPPLQGFTVFASDNKKAIQLFTKDQVVKIFTGFKNMTSLGHPYQSLAIVDGVVTLSFHPPGELKPTWGDLQENISRIEDFLEQVNIVAEEVEALEEK